MNYEDIAKAVKKVVVASERLQNLSSELQQQSQESQAAIRETREQEATRFKQDLVAMHREQLEFVEEAMRPRTVRAWQMLAGLAGVGTLVFTAFLLLLNHVEGRLRTANARVEAAELRADVYEAMRHLDITSCGGRPCIRVDKKSPKWKSGNAEYVLADGESAKAHR